MKKSLLFKGILFSLGITTTSSIALLLNSPIAHADSAPTVLSVISGGSSSSTTDEYASTGFFLNAGSNANIYINGVVQDLDGRETITAVNAVFYKNDVSGGNACTPDNQNCFTATCNLFDNADTSQKIYSCGISLPFYTTATDTSSPASGSQWLPYVTVTDGTNNGNASGNNLEINSLLSVAIPSNIDFGIRELNTTTTTANNVDMILTQQGNREVDVEVSMGAGMNCASGSFPLENMRWSLTDVDYGDASTVAITATPIDTNIDIPLGNVTTPSPTKTLYWNLAVPFGVGGNCTGTTTISAIAH